MYKVLAPRVNFYVSTDGLWKVKVLANVAHIQRRLLRCSRS